MKKLICGIVSLMLLFCATSVFADSAKDQQKARKELAKQSKKELEQKATKAARKEAKQLTKEGWKVAPGALPLEKQLDRSYLMQIDGSQEYIFGEATSIGGNYDAAKMQALELAKQNLAGQIQTEVTALIENTVSNDQMDQSDAASITKSILNGKNLISQSIGRVVPVVEIYRVVNGNQREVRVYIAYSKNMAKAVAREAVKQDLEKRGDELHGKLDQLLGW